MSNTTNTSEIDRLTMEAAADWFDRLDSLSASERNDLTSWLNASDANKRAFGLIQQTMRDSALLESMAFAPENAQTPEGELAAATAGSRLHEQAMRAWSAIRGALSPTRVAQCWLRVGRRQRPCCRGIGSNAERGRASRRRNGV